MQHSINSCTLIFFPMPPRITSCLMALLLAAPATLSAASLDHDAYVWQRRWAPPVAQAVAAQADLMRAWRVLAGQSDRGGPLAVFTPDWAALTRSGRPVVLVIRIDGPRTRWTGSPLPAAIMAVVEEWRRHDIPLAGLEIDHDSATARLEDYAAVLADLRGRLAGELPLSVTALPTWLDSPRFDGVLAQTDEVVLQVHGVEAAPHPLFERGRALAWVARMAERTAKPFRVALPTYGARIARDAAGSVLAVELEDPHPAGGTESLELVVPPQDVAALLDELKRRPPANLVGVAWFRLPTAADQRAWSPATLRAVIQGPSVDGQAHAEIRPGDVPGMVRLGVANTGATDVRLPRRVVLPSRCTVADAINGFDLNRRGDRYSLERRRDGMLPGHGRLDIGWARCAITPEELDVEN